MRTTAIMLIFMLSAINSYSQNTNLKYDNSNLILSDFERCEKFYNKITQPQSYMLYENYSVKTLNLINSNAEINNQENNATFINGNKTFALNNSDFNSLLKYLKQKNIDFTDRKGQLNTVTTDSKEFKQIYIQNFDGYSIEINNSKN